MFRIVGAVAGFFIAITSLAVVVLGGVIAGAWLIMGWLGAILMDRALLADDEKAIPLKIIFSRSFFMNSGIIGAPRLAEALMILCLRLSGLASEKAKSKSILRLPPPSPTTPP